MKTGITVEVHANGVLVRNNVTGAVIYDSPTADVTVYLDGGEIDLYDNLWVLQEAFDWEKTS